MRNINRIKLNINKDEFKKRLDIKDGKDYILTKKDKQDIAKSIDVPVGSWGSITGDIQNQTDLITLIETQAVSITIADLLALRTAENLNPNQWYLVTDFKNDLPIANASGEYHLGLTDKNRDGSQVYYPDGTAIVDGDPEQIYLLALSNKDLHPEGYSKTFPDEKIYFKPDVASIYTYPYSYQNGAETYIYYENGTNYGNTPVISPTLYNKITLDLSAKQITDLATEKTSSFWMSLSDNDNGVYPSLNSANYGDDWDVDTDGKTIIILDGSSGYLSAGFDATAINSNGYCEAGYASNVWITNGSQWQMTPTTSTTIHLENYTDEFNVRTSCSLILNDPTSGINTELTQDNFGDDWTYNNTTKNIEILDGTQQLITNGFNCLGMIEGGYEESTFAYVSKSFPNGRIIARRNEKRGVYIETDYRSQLLARYKMTSTPFAGSANPGTVYSYGLFLYLCLLSTTSTPSSTNTNYALLSPDNYLMTEIPLNIKQFQINPNLASRYDYPMFDLTTFDGLTKNIHLNIYSLPTSDLANVTIGSIGNTRDSSIYADNTHIEGNFYNNNITIYNSVASTANFYNNDVDEMMNVFLPQNFYNNKLASVRYCLLYNCYSNTGADLSYSINRQTMSGNTIATRITNCLMLWTWRDNTVYTLENCSFYGFTNLNTFVFVQNSNWYNTGQLDTSGSCSSNYFANMGSLGANYWYNICNKNQFYGIVYSNVFQVTTSSKFYGSVYQNSMPTYGGYGIATSTFFGNFGNNSGNINISSSTYFTTCTGNNFEYGIAKTVSIANGGTGYTVGDVLTLTQVSGGLQTKVTVATVSGGAVTGVTISQTGYRYVSGSTYATTGGTGNGCTITISTLFSNPLINEGIFYSTFGSNTIYQLALSNSVFRGIFANNTFNYGTNQNSISYSQFNTFSSSQLTNSSFNNVSVFGECTQNILNSGVSISTTFVSQNFSYNTIATGITLSNNTFSTMATCNINANLTGNVFPDPINNKTFSVAISNAWRLENNSIEFNGNNAKYISINRSPTGAGRDLSIEPGGALSGSTNNIGGNLVLKTGIATGSGSADIVLSATPAGASGTTDRPATEYIRLKGDGTLKWTTDNTNDIGASGANRPRTGYFGTKVIAPLVEATSTVRLKGFTVATLPTGVVGDTAYVTDALAPVWGANVAGGGAVIIKVFFDGTNWIVG